MNSFKLINFFIFYLVSAFCINFSESYSPCGPLDYDPTLLSTNYGKIQGACYQIPIDDPDQVNRTENVIIWYSVPYAQPPINQLRFQKPQAPNKWSDVKNGTVKPNACMQNSMGPPGSSTGQSVYSEDCLYLNIYANAKLYSKNNLLTTAKNQFIPKKLAPIMIFIHGGAFISGSSNGVDGTIIPALSNTIVVTINYRLGPFGFMYLNSTNIDGNMGFLDQSMAIRWVYENAKSFGGDPNRITISGQSAGSFSVSFHLIYPPSWPYFRNAIMESGTILYSTMNLFTSQEASKRTSDVLALLGCGNVTSKTYNPSKVNECALKLNSSAILTACNNYLNQNILKGNNLAKELTPLFRLVQDGKEFKYSIQESLNRKKFKRANILSGYVHDEAAFQLMISGIVSMSAPGSSSSQSLSINSTVFKNFVNNFYYYFPTYPNLSTSAFRNSLINTYTNQSTTNYLSPLIQMMSEEAFICPTIDLASIYSKFGKVFLYSYEYLSPTSMFASLGVVHGAELEMVFGQPLVPSTPSNSSSGGFGQTTYTTLQKRFSKQIITYWTNFIKNSDPNLGDSYNNMTYWPSYYNSEEYSSVLSIIKSISSYLHQIWKSWLSPMNTYLILNANATRVSNSSWRKCDFWRSYNNYPSNI